MLFFRKSVNFMSDIQMKYICRSAVEMIETHYFLLHLRFLVAKGNVDLLGMTGKY